MTNNDLLTIFATVHARNAESLGKTDQYIEPVRALRSEIEARLLPDDWETLMAQRRTWGLAAQELNAAFKVLSDALGPEKFAEVKASLTISQSTQDLCNEIDKAQANRRKASE